MSAEHTNENQHRKPLSKGLMFYNFRDGKFYLDTNGNHQLDDDNSDRVVELGRGGDP